MAAVVKIDSNATGLAYAEEATIGVLPGSPVWKALEPNSYADFGGELALVARNPINADRQLKKGVTTDLDASGGFQTDLTQANLQDLLQGFFWASLRKKVELAVAVVDTTIDDYQPASGGDGYYVNDLLFAKGFTDAANNGLKVVTGVPGATSVPVTSNLVTAAAQAGTISRVGHQFGTGDATIDASGTYPKLTATAKNLTQLGLLVGEWVFIGGDLTAEQFATAADNCWARVRSIAAAAIEFDKTSATMVTDAGTGKTIRIFFGRVLHNELSGTIVRRTYQLERQLGAPDDALPAQIQSEYLVGAVPNEFTMNIATADKITCDLSFVGTNVEQRSGATGVKAGTRVAVEEADAFNTSSDFARIKLSAHVDGTENPAALFAFLSELKLTINNGVKPNKAVGTLGAVEVSSGNFHVNGTMTAYFADVAAIQSVMQNSDITLDVAIAKANQGIVIDLPLVALGDGRPTVAADEPVMIPLSFEAATGAKFGKNYTMWMEFYDYLPTRAEQ